MKKIFLLTVLIISLFADAKKDVFDLYQNEKYESACKLGHRWFDKYVRDEEFISLYAFSCLKSDYIDRLALPISMLKFSKEARANSAYLSVILMQKKLLYHSLVDGYDLSELKLPNTDHILSKVFDMYAKLGKHERRNVYIFDDEESSKISYRLYLVQDGNLKKMVIEEFYDTISVQRHIYW